MRETRPTTGRRTARAADVVSGAGVITYFLDGRERMARVIAIVGFREASRAKRSATCARRA